MVAALSLSMKVHAVAFFRAGGICICSEPPSVAAALLVAAAGLGAQVLLLVATVVWLWHFGAPATRVGNGFVLSFTVGNVLLLAANAVPSEGTDGEAILGLLRSIRRPF